MKCYLYDCEVFKNYFSAVFIDYEDYHAIRKKIDVEKISRLEAIKLIESIPYIIFEISSVEGYEKDDTAKILSFTFSGNYLAGFNNNDYDNMLLNFIAMNYTKDYSIKKFNMEIYNFSKELIETDKEILRNLDKFKYVRRFNANYKSIDVQKIPSLDKVRKSLKQTLINLKWYDIITFELPPISDLDKHFYDERFISNIDDWDRYLVKEYIPDLKIYNRNDVLGVGELFYYLHDDIELRFKIGAKYGINVDSASQAKIGDRIFQKFYLDKTGISHKDFYGSKTYRNHVKLSDCISDKIQFKTKELKDLRDKVYHTTVKTTKELSINFVFDGTEYNIKSGGIHSVDLPGVYRSSNNVKIIDADVSSYYPSLIITNKVKPKHMHPYFLTLFEFITDDRITGKQEGDYVKALTLKYTINIIYGKFAFEFGPYYDLQCTFQTTINGQLALMMLVERLSLIGIKTISANTDGILCLVPNDKQEIYNKTCEQWQKDVSLNLEFNNYSLYVRRDVNAYFAVKEHEGEYNEEKHLKRKSALHDKLYYEDLQKGFDKPIVARAIINYFKDGISVSETLRKHTDIYDFCTTNNIGREFALKYIRVINGQVITEYPQRNVRFYISTNGGSLIKIKKNNLNGNGANMCAGQKVTIFNRYFHKDNMEDYNIDYLYYQREANKIINQIETNVKRKAGSKKRIRNELNQPSLFD